MAEEPIQGDTRALAVADAVIEAGRRYGLGEISADEYLKILQSATATLTPQGQEANSISVNAPAATTAVNGVATVAEGAGEGIGNPLLELQKKLERGEISANDYPEGLRKLTSPDQPANPALGSAATTVDTTLSAGTATSVRRQEAAPAGPVLNSAVEKAAEEYLSAAIGDRFLDEKTRASLIRQTQAIAGTPEEQVDTMLQNLKGLTDKMKALREGVTATVIESNPSLAGDPDAINRAVDGEMAAMLKDKPHLLLRGEGTGVTSLAVANKELDELLRQAGVKSAPEAAVNLVATKVANEALEALNSKLLDKTFGPPETDLPDSQKRPEVIPERVPPTITPTDPASHSPKNDSIDPITRTKDAISDLFTPLRGVQPASSDRSVQPPSSNVGLAESSPTSPLAGGNTVLEAQPQSPPSSNVGRVINSPTSPLTNTVPEAQPPRGTVTLKESSPTSPVLDGRSSGVILENSAAQPPRGTVGLKGSSPISPVVSSSVEKPEFDKLMGQVQMPKLELPWENATPTNEPPQTPNVKQKVPLQYRRDM